MMEKNSILIVDAMHESILPLLSEAGLRPEYRPDIQRDEILSIIEGYKGLIIRSKTSVDAELVDKGSNLRFVARAGAGMDEVDLDYLEYKNIAAINAPEGNRDALGEHAIGMLLGLLHKINAADREVKRSVWRREDNRGIELKGRTVGIYGFGHMGQAFAEKLASMGCNIIAYDKFKTNYSTKYVQAETLQSFREQTEILSLHLPLTKATQFLFDYENLKRYPCLKVLLNTSRGKVLRLEDAVRLAEEGNLYGLGLDVLENETLSTYNAEEQSLFKRLTRLHNVILTPHVGGWTSESYRRINEVMVKKISCCIQYSIKS